MTSLPLQAPRLIRSGPPTTPLSPHVAPSPAGSSTAAMDRSRAGPLSIEARPPAAGSNRWHIANALPQTPLRTLTARFPRHHRRLPITRGSVR